MKTILRDALREKSPVNQISIESKTAGAAVCRSWNFSWNEPEIKQRNGKKQVKNGKNFDKNNVLTNKLSM